MTTNFSFLFQDTLKFILLFVNIVSRCQCANILCVMIPFTQKSHYNMLRPIGLELARRGHNVTVITAFKETDHPPTYYQVMADDKKLWDLTGKFTFAFHYVVFFYTISLTRSV